MYNARQGAEFCFFLGTAEPYPKRMALTRLLHPAQPKADAEPHVMRVQAACASPGGGKRAAAAPRRWATASSGLQALIGPRVLAKDRRQPAEAEA